MRGGGRQDGIAQDRSNCFKLEQIQPRTHRPRLFARRTNGMTGYLSSASVRSTTQSPSPLSAARTAPRPCRRGHSPRVVFLRSPLRFGNHSSRNGPVGQVDNLPKGVDQRIRSRRSTSGALNLLRVDGPAPVLPIAAGRPTAINRYAGGREVSRSLPAVALRTTSSPQRRSPAAPIPSESSWPSDRRERAGSGAAPAFRP